MTKKTPEQTNWVCTDPDNLQYGRWISNFTYEFKEYDHLECEWKQFEVNLNEYSLSQMEDKISGYYDSIEDIFSLYGKDAFWIIAETIFEQENGMY